MASLALTLCAASASYGQAPLPSLTQGNQFYSRCQRPDTVEQSLSCFGYFRGLVDGMNWALSKSFCIPADVTYQQMTDIVLKYMRDNPEVRHWGMPAIYAWVAGFSFPCSLSPPPPPNR